MKTYTFERLDPDTGAIVEHLTGLTADEVLAERGLDGVRIVLEEKKPRDDYDGKWVISGCEEHWDFAEVYDTKDEAIANVPGYCDEYDREYEFVGQARKLTYEGLLAQGDVEQMIEAMDERSYEEGGCEDPIIELDNRQMDFLRMHIVEWMDTNLNPINWYSVESVTEHPTKP